jgi:TetR/AcrR family transcriptional regulator, mexJK operon transcriptional repressor
LHYLTLDVPAQPELALSQEKDRMSVEAPQDKGFKRGPGGRPSVAEAERRQRVLLDCAMQLFLEQGFDAVSIDEIARRSGVAKRFIYARYKGKEEIFVAAIEQCFAERLEHLLEFDTLPADPEEGLTHYAARLLDLALAPDALAMNRLFTMVAPRFPELTRKFIERGRHRNLGGVRRLLQAYADRGVIVSSDMQLLAESFFILIVGIPQRFALLGLRETPDDESRRLQQAVRLFLEGCRPRKS